MNKAEITTTIIRYLKRKDLNDLIPSWLEFAGLRIDTDCRLPEQEYRTTTIPDGPFILLPSDFIEMRNIQTQSSGNLPLQYLTPEQLDNMSRRVRQGPQQFYTIVNNQLELVPAPAADSEVEMELFYYARLPVLVNDSDSNKILDQFPQLYIYAVMVEAMPFLEHVEGQNSWSVMYRDLVKILNDRAQAGRFSGNSLQMRAV